MRDLYEDEQKTYDDFIRLVNKFELTRWERNELIEKMDTIIDQIIHNENIQDDWNL